MKGKTKLLNLFIIAEVIVLIAVLGLSAFVTLRGDAKSVFGEEEETEAETSADIGEEDNEIEAAADLDSDADRDNTIGEETETVSDTYDTIRLTFSDEVEDLLDSFTTGELAAQLFVTTPDELTGVEGVNVAGEGLQKAISDYPVSGLVFEEQNIAGDTQIEALTTGALGYSEDTVDLGMFLIIEELGGDASPVAETCGFEVQASPADLAEDGSTSGVTSAAEARAEYLLASGFNTVLGPIADAAGGSDDAFDVLTYGDTALNAADYVEADIRAVQSAGMSSIVQAFPGVSTAAEDMSAYQAAIDAGVNLIQISNITDSDITGDDTLPCSLSAAVTEKIRDEMGFTGLLMTDDLSESAVTDYYDVGEAAVKAVRAGMNLLYVSDGFEEAYEAVLEAVESGDITETMLMNAAGRVLTQKLEL